MAKTVRVLVISDLHAVDDASKFRSEVAMNYAQTGVPRALMNQSYTAVRDKFPDGVDLVVVAGDMTDKAGGSALVKVWDDLNWLAHQFSAPLVATSGNHDYDSRASQSLSPKQSLMSLDPPFPFGTKAGRDHYFAQEHAVFVDQHFAVVSANSSAFHGYIPKGQEESEHGRFGEYLPGYIRESLDALNDLPPFKIFLTHHHLNQLPGFDTEEVSSSRGHEAVLRTLSDYGDWVIVHGHKHRGWLQYGSGNGDAPPLISSSSFSADFGSGSFSDKVRHQFHVLELREDDGSFADLNGQSGRIFSWTHSPLGWMEASASDDLPGVSGFGWKTNIWRLASVIRSEIVAKGVMEEADIETFEPRLRFLTFDDQRRLIRYLSDGDPKVDVDVHSDGRVREIVLSTKTV
ncbi:putative phosphodiesterase [Curtobacterium flaccumfaciens]|nr:metallophosphoesterase [Curtobacterium flaccumfaciens]MDQ0540293.1 putative phosphodiesterase [Curtobacterium flaccumfaciens]